MHKFAYKLQGHTEVQGLPVAIENRKGSVRKGTDEDGHEWRTKMKHPYGYIVGTRGADGEPVDAYVGPHVEAPDAFVVHQHKDDGTGYDEDKVMLGFKSKADAKKAYLAHYDDPKFLGPISRVSVERLKELVAMKKKLVKISSVQLASMADEMKTAAYGDTVPLWADENVGRVDYESKEPLKSARVPVREAPIPTADEAAMGERPDDGRDDQTLTTGPSIASDLAADAFDMGEKTSLASAKEPSKAEEAKRSVKLFMQHRDQQGRPKKWTGPQKILARAGAKVGQGIRSVTGYLNKEAMLDELHKLGAINPEQAREALSRLEALEENPTGEQVAGYTGIGALAGPAIAAVGRAVKGPSLNPFSKASLNTAHPIRQIASEAATGALFSGAMPLVRNEYDKYLETRKLKDFLSGNESAYLTRTGRLKKGLSQRRIRDAKLLQRVRERFPEME